MVALRVLAVLLVLSTFAGCASAPALKEEQTDPSVVVLEPTDGGATLTGLVTDIELVPVEGAAVAIGGIDTVAATDAAGQFGFRNLRPGPVELFVSKPGFETYARRLEAPADETTEVTVRLTRLAIATPYHVTIEYAAFLDCAVAAHQGPYPVYPCNNLAVVAPNNGIAGARGAAFMNGTIDAATFVIDATWTPSAYASGRELVLGGRVRTDAQFTRLGAVTGGSPLSLRFDAPLDKNPDAATSKTILIGWDINIPNGSPNPPYVSYVFQQRAKVFGSLFLVDPAPAGFSALPDA